MAASYTYDTLKTALIDFTEDDGAEFASALDQIIALGESKLLKDLDLEIFDTTAVGTFTPGSPLVTKPSYAIAIRSMYYTDGSGNFVFIEQKPYEFVKDYWPRQASTTSTPKYYAELNETQLFIAGTPATGLAYTLRVIRRPDGLSSLNTTTWLSTKAADALLYACLVTSEQFLKADNRIGTWRSEYQLALNSAKIELKRTDRTDYSPATATPDA